MARIPTIGELRQIGYLYKNYPSPLTAGKKDHYYYLVDPTTGGMYTARGRLREIRGNRGLEVGELLLETKYEWICRMSGVLEGAISKSSRWVIGSKRYTIDSVSKINEKEFFYRFVLNEAS